MEHMDDLSDYRRVVGEKEIKAIQSKAEKIRGKHILMVNSTYQGGGVAEILNSLVVLFHRVGVNLGWRVLHGTPDFFAVTKKFHNALQGKRINLSKRKKKIYFETNKRFSSFNHIDHDLVIIHDPQPLPLISFYKKDQPWIFRCHIDISKPNKKVWEYLRGFIDKYDHFVVSMLDYQKSDLRIPQSIITPSIDPLSTKNKTVREKAYRKYLSKFGVDLNKPIISQISRFDRWKDPLGVIRIFEAVRKEEDCQLVLLGQFAADDPEGQQVFQSIEKRVKRSPLKEDINLLMVDNDFLVNCLQRASTVVIQKSLREGFGLTVTEALYKRTPVVASKVGGIPLQIIDGVNGFLHHPKDIKGFSKSVISLIKNENLREEMGRRGREHVHNNFLITRLLQNWLDLINSYIGS
jgi:trehalose synthase